VRCFYSKRVLMSYLHQFIRILVLKTYDLVGSFGHFSVCPSISGFWLLIWYLQTFPKIMQCAWIKMGSTINNGRKSYIQFRCLLSQDISMVTERTIYFVSYFIHHFFLLCFLFEIFKMSFVCWSTSCFYSKRVLMSYLHQFIRILVLKTYDW
jgi:hypothetical protein